jgi:hypothetical protein
MQTVVSEWVRRILGYGAAAASGVVATKVGDPELGAWVGSGVAIVGAYVLNRALPILFPTTRKIVQQRR